MRVGQDHQWQRCADVLWRVGPDRVLARRVAGAGHDLLGLASMVWVALDVPRSTAAVLDELQEIDPELTDVGLLEALAELEHHGLVERR